MCQQLSPASSRCYGCSERPCVCCHLGRNLEVINPDSSKVMSVWFLFLKYFGSDVHEDIGDSDTGSDSLEDSHGDFLAYDDDGVVIPISRGQMNTNPLLDFIPLCKLCRSLIDPDTVRSSDNKDDSDGDEDLMYNQGRGKSSGNASIC